MKSENFEFPKKNNSLLVSDNDLWILSYYAASELTGGLLMGRMARQSKNDELRGRLIWHSAEETRHAVRWVEIIRKLGGDPQQIEDTYQSNYFSHIGIPEGELDLMIITQVFELRVARHFTIHRQRLDVHPLIDTMLATMIADEAEHIRWVREKLEAFAQQSKKNKELVAKKCNTYKAIDNEVYQQEAQKFVKLGWKVPHESEYIPLEITI